MQPAAFGVDAIEAGRDARQMPAGLQRLFDVPDCFSRRLQKALHRAGFALTLGDLVERAFCSLDLAFGVDALAGIERIIDKRAAYRDQLAEQCEVVNLLGKITRANQASAVGSQLYQIARATQFTHCLVRLKKRL